MYTYIYIYTYYHYYDLDGACVFNKEENEAITIT